MLVNRTTAAVAGVEEHCRAVVRGEKLPDIPEGACEAASRTGKLKTIDEYNGRLHSSRDGLRNAGKTGVPDNT